MKGLLFYDYDRGRGGPCGFLDHAQKWCVEIGGEKQHICNHVTGSLGFPEERGGPHRDLSIEPCDGSCTKLVDIPDEIWDMVLLELEPEEARRPEELACATGEDQPASDKDGSWEVDIGGKLKLSG